MSDIPSSPAGNPPAADPTAFKAGLPTPPPPSEPSTYRPISGFAIAGFATACVFGLMVLVVAAVALLKSEPFFYPVWVLLLPAAGLILSLVARSQIRNAEGTRAGEGLAKAGIWISVFTGLGYFVYDRVTGLAVTSQANAFLMDEREDSGFFPHLEKASTNKTDFFAAFLLSQPPTKRGPVRPEDHAGMVRLHDNVADGSPGALSSFRNHVLVRLITTAPPATVTVEPLGVQNWEYESRSYAVRRLYRVTTPEAAVEVSILVMSSEGETAGEPRKWFVVLNRIGKTTEKQVKFTELGEGLRILRFLAREALLRWQEKLNAGEPFALAQIDRTDWDRLQMPAQQRAYLQARLQDIFRGKEPGRLAQLQFPGEDPLVLGDWEIDKTDGKVRFTYPFKMKADPRAQEPPYVIEGYVTMESTAAVDPKSVRLGSPAPEVGWQVYSMQISRAGTASSMMLGRKDVNPLPISPKR